MLRINCTAAVSAALALVSIVDACAASTLSIYDVSYDVGAWTAKVYSGSAASQTSVTLTRITSGSEAGLHGNAQRSTVTGPGGFSFDIAHKKTDVSWDPNLRGPIESLIYRAEYNIASSGIGFSILLFQGDSIYAPPNARFFEPPVTGVWQTPSPATFQISEFGLASGSGPALTFAPGAAPIFFGYGARRSVTNRGSTNFRSSAFEVTVTGVPEPSTILSLQAAAAIGGLWKLRRRS